MKQEYAHRISEAFLQDPEERQTSKIGNKRSEETQQTRAIPLNAGLPLRYDQQRVSKRGTRSSECGRTWTVDQQSRFATTSIQ